VPCPEEEKPKTVQCSGWTWTHIRRVTVRARSNGTLDTTIAGVSNSGSGTEFNLHSARSTPVQVLAICAIAGWPEPEVRCVFTYCDGTACEVDPAHVKRVVKVDMPDARYTHIVGGANGRNVREPVAVVEKMLAACREGE
jgi:hypothetical protein